MRKDPEKEREYQREYQRRLRAANPGLAAERSRRFRAKHPSYAREYGHRAQGLPAPTRAEPRWCECCGEAFKKTPHLDHDHVTGEFRGWICSLCNHGLGLLGDDVAGVKKALAYLRRANADA